MAAPNLDYWAKVGFLPPSVRRASGRGSRNTWGFRDLVAMVVVRELRSRVQDLALLKPTIDFIRLDQRLDLETLSRRDTLLAGETGGFFSRYHPFGEDGSDWHIEHIEFGDGVKSLPFVEPPADLNTHTVSWINLHKIVTELRQRIAERAAAEGENHGKATADAGGSRGGARRVAAPGAPAGSR